MSIRASLVFIAVSAAPFHARGSRSPRTRTSAWRPTSKPRCYAPEASCERPRSNCTCASNPRAPLSSKPTARSGWPISMPARRRSSSAHGTIVATESPLRVTADGAPFLESLDGQAMPLDPGPHVLRFERGSDKPIEQRERLHGKASETDPSPCSSAAPKSPPPKSVPPGSPAPQAGAGLGAVGVAGVGSFAYFGLSGRADLDCLRSRCAPSCAPYDIDSSAQRKLIIADVSLGVGLASLGAATWLFLSKSSKSPTPGTVSQVEVRPLLRGGVAEVTVSF